MSRGIFRLSLRGFACLPIRVILEIELNEEEQKKFNESAKIIHEMVDEIEL